MKYLLIFPTLFLVLSCSKQSVTNPSINSDNYIVINGVKHICNKVVAGNSPSPETGYYIILDSADAGNTYYDVQYSMIGISLQTYSVPKHDVTQFGFENYFVAPHVSSETSDGTITITNNSNGEISGHFFATCYFDYMQPGQITENVSGVFNHVKVMP